MADSKEIKISASIGERYTSKFQRSLDAVQKNGSGVFNEKNLKGMNRELEKMVKHFSKMGVDIKGIAKSMSTDWANGIKTATKRFEEYGKLIKKTQIDSKRAGAVVGRLNDPGYQQNFTQRHMAANRDPLATNAEKIAAAEAALSTRRAVAQGRLEASGQAGRDAAAAAHLEQMQAQDERQSLLRSRIMTIGSTAAGAAQMVAMAYRYPTERYRNTTQGIRTSSAFYDRFAQGDLSMASTLATGGAEAIAAGEREESASLWATGGKMALGAALIGGGLFTGGATSMLGLGLIGGGAVSLAQGGFDLATGKAGSERQKATAEYLELLNQNDPTRKRILTDAAQNATGYAQYLGQFGGGIDSTIQSGNQGRNFSAQFAGMAGQAQKFGYDWRQTMGLHSQLSGQYGTQNAYSMMPAVTSAEQVLGMSGSSVSGGIGSMALAGNTRASQAFIEMMAKAVTKGMDQTKMREDFVSMAASFSSSGLGRSAGGMGFAADVALGGLNMKDMGQLPVMMQAMKAMDAVSGAQTGEVGVINRGLASQGISNFVAKMNARRKAVGLKPVFPSAKTQYGIEDELQQASIGDIATGNLRTAETGLSLLYKPDAQASSFAQLDPSLTWEGGGKQEFLKEAAAAKIRMLEVVGGENFDRISGDSDEAKRDRLNLFRQLTQRGGIPLNEETLSQGGGAIVRAVQLMRQGINPMGKDEQGNAYLTPEQKQQMELVQSQMKSGGTSNFAGISAEAAGAMNQMFKDMSDPGVKVTLDSMKGVLGVLLGAASRADDIKKLVEALGPLAGSTQEKEVMVIPAG